MRLGKEAKKEGELLGMNHLLPPVDVSWNAKQEVGTVVQKKVAYGLTFVFFGIVKIHTGFMKPSLSTSKRSSLIMHKIITSSIMGNSQCSGR